MNILKQLVPLVLALLFAVPVRADFTPVHPFLYMDQADIDVMKDNVLNKKYPWAVNLYNKARACSKTTGWNYFPYGMSRDMMACALVYQISGDKSYADAAVRYLNLFRTNFDPRDQTVVGGMTLEKRYHFQPVQVLIPVVYDLMYNYMKTDKPADLTALTTYVTWLITRFQGSFGHNENHQNHYGRGMCALVTGNTQYANEVAEDFKAWYGSSNKVHDGFHYEIGSQAMKHYAFVIESQIYYLNGAHRAAQKRYTPWDPVTWKTADGFNVIHDNWRFLAKKSTPLFQVPYESMWRGNNYLTPTCSGIYNIAYCMTGNTEWQAMAAANPGCEIIKHYTVNTYWTGLSHGREITGTPRFLNDCVKNDAIGKGVLLSGDPAGHTDPATSLHAYLLAGNYGSSGAMNLKLYGKGKKLNGSPLDNPVDSWGERGSGGSLVDPRPGSTADQLDPVSTTVWDVTDKTVKVMAFTNQNRQRSVAVTDDYFVDVFCVPGNDIITWNFHGIGPSSSALSKSGTFTGDFTCTWPDHMKAYVINDVNSEVSLGTMTNVPWMISGVSNRQVNPIYTTEVYRRLTVRRRGLTSGTKFISVIEPLSGGGVISSVTKFDCTTASAVTGLKIVAAGYTDYYVYNQGSGSATLTQGGESITINGKWGFIRKNNNGTLVVRGTVSSHNISGTPVQGLVATPVINPAGGTFETSRSVTISCATTGASVYYTTNGSTPTESSAKYTGAITIDATTTVKARAFKAGETASSTASAVFTKETPVVTDPDTGTVPGPGGNLALGRPVTSSSAQSGRGAALACDGDDATRWSSLYSEPEWLQADLGQPYALGSVVLKWEAAYGSAYRIEVSDNGSSWSTAYTQNAGTGGTETLELPAGTVGRYVRMYGTSRGTAWGFSLWEFEVYGAAQQSGISTGTVAGTKRLSMAAAGLTGLVRQGAVCYDAGGRSVGPGSRIFRGLYLVRQDGAWVRVIVVD